MFYALKGHQDIRILRQRISSVAEGRSRLETSKDKRQWTRDKGQWTMDKIYVLYSKRTSRY